MSDNREKSKTLITCSECEMAIIEGRHYDDPAVQEHLSNCAECREFAWFQEAVLSAEPVVESAIPELSVIKAEAQRRSRVKRNVLRLVVIPLSMAAAAAVVVGGIFFQNYLHMAQDIYRNDLIADTALTALAGANGEQETVPMSFPEEYFYDSDEFADLLEESSIVLAWDNTSSSENQCRNSMRAALYGNDQWSIEVFNPYSEE